MESLFKRISDTAKSTVSVIGDKSADLVSTGKLKLEIRQIENKIKAKKQDIGELAYSGYAANGAIDQEAIFQLCQEISELETEIASLASQQEPDKEVEPAGDVLSDSGGFCSNCGQPLESGVKFCSHCGHKRD